MKSRIIPCQKPHDCTKTEEDWQRQKNRLKIYRKPLIGQIVEKRQRKSDQHNAQCQGNKSKDQRLQQKLENDLAAVGAHGLTDSDLAGAICRTRRGKVDEVDTG